MAQTPEEVEEEQLPPQGHVKLVYLGPVAPHWEVQSDFGDRSMIEEFRARARVWLRDNMPPDGTGRGRRTEPGGWKQERALQQGGEVPRRMDAGD